MLGTAPGTEVRDRPVGATRMTKHQVSELAGPGLVVGIAATPRRTGSAILGPPTCSVANDLRAGLLVNAYCRRLARASGWHADVSRISTLVGGEASDRLLTTLAPNPDDDIAVLMGPGLTTALP